MTESKTVVGSTEATENSLTLYGVDAMNTAEVNVDGKIYLGRSFSGEHVKYALKTEGVISQVGRVDGTVVMNDVDALDTGKVVTNGLVYVGSEFIGKEATIAAKTIDPVDYGLTSEECGNQQTAETSS